MSSGKAAAQAAGHALAHKIPILIETPAANLSRHWVLYGIELNILFLFCHKFACIKRQEGRTFRFLNL